MEHSIIAKLRPLLGNQPSNEAETLYVLAEIRKLLEINKHPNQYTNLNFACNWALHSRLEKNQADKRIREIDDLLYKTFFGNGQTQAQFLRMADHLCLAAFRTELDLFLGSFDLPRFICQQDGNWGLFVGHYISIVEDVPWSLSANVRLQAAPLRMVDAIVLQTERHATLQLGNQITHAIHWILHYQGKHVGSLIVPAGQIATSTLLGSIFQPAKDFPMHHKKTP